MKDENQNTETKDQGGAPRNGPASGSIRIWFILKGQKRKRNGVISRNPPMGLDRSGVEDWLTTSGKTYGTHGDGKTHVTPISEPSPLEQWMVENGIEALENWGLRTN